MKCSHCNLDFEENKIHEHHIHPRFMNNKKGDDMKIYLCEKCHNKIHLIIPSIYWELLSSNQKIKAIIKVKSFSKKYGGINDTNTA